MTSSLLSRALSAVALLGIAAAAIPAHAQTYTLNPFTGDPAQVFLTVSQLTGTSVKFDVSVNTAVSMGDLRGVFFNVANESLISGLTVTGADVTSYVKSANNVSDLGNGANISPEGPFDVGVEIGTAGIGKDDIQTTSFVVSSPVALSTTQFTTATDPGPTPLVFAARVMSVGANRSGSSKLGVGVTGSPVPEPASLSLLAGAMIGVVALRRKRK